MSPSPFQVAVLACCAAAGTAAGYFLSPKIDAGSISGLKSSKTEASRGHLPVLLQDQPADEKVRLWLARVQETPAERYPAELRALLDDFPGSSHQEPTVQHELLFTAWLGKDEAGLLKWMGTVSGEDTEFLRAAAKTLGKLAGERLWPSVKRLCAIRADSDENHYLSEDMLESMAIGWAEGAPGSYLRAAPGDETLEEWTTHAAGEFARKSPDAARVEIAEQGDPFQAKACMPDLMQALYAEDPAKAKDWLLTLQNKEVRAEGIAAWLHEHSLTDPGDTVVQLEQKNWMSAELSSHHKRELLPITARTHFVASVALMQGELRSSSSHDMRRMPPVRWVSPQSSNPQSSNQSSGQRIRIASTGSGSGSGSSGTGGAPSGIPVQKPSGVSPFAPVRRSVPEPPLDEDLAGLAGEFGIGLQGPAAGRVATALTEVRKLPSSAEIQAQMLAEALGASASRWPAGEMRQGIEEVIELPEELRKQALRSVINSLIEADCYALMQMLKELPPESLAIAGKLVQLAALADVSSGVSLLYRLPKDSDSIPADYFDRIPPSPESEAAARAAGSMALSAYAKNVARIQPDQAPGWAAALPQEIAHAACSGAATVLGLTDHASALRWVQSLPAGQHRAGAIEGLAEVLRFYDKAAADALTNMSEADTNSPTSLDQ